MSFGIKFAIAAALVVASAFALVYVSECRARQGLHDLPGAPKRAFVRGDRLVLVDHVTSSVGRANATTAVGERLTAVELATGKPVAERIFEGGGDCWPARGDHIWCDAGTELVALDAGFATVGEADTAAARLGTPVPGKYQASQGDVVLDLPDGHRVRVTGDSLVARRDDAPIPREDDERKCHTSQDVQVPAGGYLRFGDGPRFGLVHADQNYAQVKVPADAPVFLRADGYPEFWRAPELYLIRHDTTVDKATALPRLSRVDVDRRVEWTAPVGKGSCQLVTQVGRTLVLAFAGTDLRAETVDVDTGAVGWTYAR